MGRGVRLARHDRIGRVHAVVLVPSMLGHRDPFPAAEEPATVSPIHIPIAARLNTGSAGYAGAATGPERRSRMKLTVSTATSAASCNPAGSAIPTAVVQSAAAAAVMRAGEIPSAIAARLTWSAT